MPHFDTLDEAIAAIKSGCEAVDLEGKKIGNAGLVLLSAALHEGNVRVLNLDDNDIVGAAGIKSLVHALLACRTVQTLSLNNNKIDDEGAVVLAEWLRTV